VPPVTARERSIRRVRSDATFGLLAINAIPIAGLLFFILRYSANVPILDTWGFVPALCAFVIHGHVSFSNLWAADGDARPIIWRLLMLVDAREFSFDVQLIKALAVPAALLELGAIYCVVRKIERRQAWKQLLILLPITLTVFGLGNWENVLEEWNVQNIAAVAVSLVALMAIASTLAATSSARRILLAAGILACVIASLLGEPGLVSWPAAIVVVCFPWTRGRALERTCLIVAMLVFFGIYLPGTGGAVLSYDPTHPLAVAEFAIAALGTGILGMVDNQPALGVAIAFGTLEIVLSVAAAIVLLRSKAARMEPCRYVVALIVFGLLGAGAIAAGRVTFGLATATSSRYAVTTAPASVGLYLFYLRLFLDARASRRLGLPDRGRSAAGRVPRLGFGAAACVAAAAMLFGSVFGDLQQYSIRGGRATYFTSLEYYACHVSSTSDAELELFQHYTAGEESSFAFMRSAIGELRAARFSVFSGTTCASVSDS
jgi:hypothetical protein